MFLNEVINYLSAWEEFNELYPEEYLDIITSIENLNIQKEALDGKLPFENIGISRESWESFLLNHGWSKYRENGRLRGIIGLKKNMTTAKLLIGSRDIVNSWLFTESNLAIKSDNCKIPILILPMKETSESLGRHANLRDNFERILSVLKEISPLTLEYPFLILGISDHETPLEIINIPSNMEGHNSNVVMNRSIEFPPEYYQAGLGILSYFHNILNEKYPGIQATVRIIQDGLVVKMIVETEDGNRHIVEKALEEYDLILKGEMRPEDYFDPSAQIQILELKNELRMAQVRIESQKELLAFKRNQIMENKIHISKLFEMISNGIKPPIIHNHVSSSPVITVDTTLNQQTNIYNELSKTVDTIRDLKSILTSPDDIKLLNEVERELSETDESKLKDSTGVSKLKAFLDNVSNAESSVSKSITTTNESLQLVKKLAKHYNTIAPWCGLPGIPFIK